MRVSYAVKKNGRDTAGIALFDIGHGRRSICINISGREFHIITSSHIDAKPE
jgi:hypothetical protein